MKNGDFFKSITKLQNEPRWGEHFPTFKDNAASHSYRVGLYTLIASLLEKEYFDSQIDVTTATCKAIFHDMNETRIGPMKHRTKKEDYVEDLIQKLEHEENVNLVNLLSKSLRPTFENYIINAEDDTEEGRLVDAVDSFDAMFFCLREMDDGIPNQFFRDTYSHLFNKLRESPFQSIQMMLDSIEKRDPFFNFLKEGLMLDQIERWKGKYNTIDDDDATHVFRSTAFAIFFSSIEEVKYNRPHSRFNLVGKMICHDLPEIRTGDVLGPVKHSTPEMKKAFEEYEMKVATEIVSQLPEKIQNHFIDFTRDAKDNTYEGVMVDISDKIDALIKSNLERRINEKEYEFKYRNQLKSIQKKFTLPSVLFFLAYILHDMDSPTFEE